MALMIYFVQPDEDVLLFNERYLNFQVRGRSIITKYCYIFNIILEMGYFSLFTKGSINEPTNYRGITLLSGFGKLLSRVLNNSLDNWAEEYNIYIEAQAGLRAGICTVDNIFVLHGVVKHCISECKRLYATFVDFTKAFDYVVRENLWLKLIKFWVGHRILNVIKSMYQSVKSIVNYNNCLSEDFTCYLGVRHGECLSPFLFSFYLNDLENEFAQNGLEE